MIYHTPVLLQECLRVLRDNLDAESGEKKILVDCNLGEGGHSSEFLKTFDNLNIIALDCDEEIIDIAKDRLKEFGGRIEFNHSWSNEFIKNDLEDNKADCIFFDFGISMFHYKGSGRGFSFINDEKLDMRLDESQQISAYTIVNYTKERELADLIYKYSDEKKSRKIANNICNARAKKKIETTGELKTIIDSCFSSFEKAKANVEVATRTFQAIRIAVNNELSRIKEALDGAIRKIKKNGIIMAISFHGSEDRIIKWTFREASKDGNYSILTKHPIVPSDEEININNASRSAKLRVLRRVV